MLLWNSEVSVTHRCVAERFWQRISGHRSAALPATRTGTGSRMSAGRLRSTALWTSLAASTNPEVSSQAEVGSQWRGGDVVVRLADWFFGFSLSNVSPNESALPNSCSQSWWIAGLRLPGYTDCRFFLTSANDITAAIAVTNVFSKAFSRACLQRHWTINMAEITAKSSNGRLRVVGHFDSSSRRLWWQLLDSDPSDSLTTHLMLRQFVIISCWNA